MTAFFSLLFFFNVDDFSLFYFQLYWSIIEKNCNIPKVFNRMIEYTVQCERILTKLMNTFITLYIYLFFFFKWEHKFYCLISNFQLYNRGWATAVFMSYLRSYSSSNWKSLPFHQSVPPDSGNHNATLFLWVWLLSFQESMYDTMPYLSFSVWLSSLSIIPSKFMDVGVNGKISFKIRLNNIPVCVCVSHIFLVHWRKLGLLPYLDYREYCCSEHGGTDNSSKW